MNIVPPAPTNKTHHKRPPTTRSVGFGHGDAWLKRLYRTKTQPSRRRTHQRHPYRTLTTRRQHTQKNSKHQQPISTPRRIQPKSRRIQRLRNWFWRLHGFWVLCAKQSLLVLGFMQVAPLFFSFGTFYIFDLTQILDWLGEFYV